MERRSSRTRRRWVHNPVLTIFPTSFPLPRSISLFVSKSVSTFSPTFLRPAAQRHCPNASFLPCHLSIPFCPPHFVLSCAQAASRSQVDAPRCTFRVLRTFFFFLYGSMRPGSSPSDSDYSQQPPPFLSVLSSSSVKLSPEARQELKNNTEKNAA